MINGEEDRKIIMEGESQIYEFIYTAQHTDFKCLEINVCAVIVNFILGVTSWGSANFLNLWPPLLLTDPLFSGCIALFVLLIV
jgi:hypothetical protein